jgi:thiosulfate dehydrogenase
MRNKTLYLLVGIIVGISGFWIFHKLFPGSFHNKKQTEASWRIRNIETDLPEGKAGEIVKYGYELITKTTEYIGPLAKDKKMRFAGNNLSCNNCHLNAGRKIGSGSFMGVFNRFPQFRPRENKMGTLEERINGCMERSMNGKAMDENSFEMQAMIAYMEWLSEGIPEDQEKLYKGYLAIEIPEYSADTIKGRELYEIHCIACHKIDGSGTRALGSDFKGYLYPPVGGEDSYNDGAGMNRVITAAQFLKGNMPFGATVDDPLLTDDQSYHLAAYINTFTRPTKTNREEDFPDKSRKPVSTPYGPWVDSFSPDQHKFGPFPPIIEFYKKEYNLTKSK